MADMATSLMLFEELTGKLPTDDEGLHALTKPILIRGEYRPLAIYLRRDPWEHDYQYRQVATAKDRYELYSTGRDINDPTDDVIYNK